MLNQLALKENRSILRIFHIHSIFIHAYYSTQILPPSPSSSLSVLPPPPSWLLVLYITLSLIGAACVYMVMGLFFGAWATYQQL